MTDKTTELSPPTAVWRHVNTGGLYRVIATGACMEAEGAATREFVVYQRADGDGIPWIRPQAEFMDGRFQKEASPAPPAVALEPVAPRMPEHVCGLQGFGALGDRCEACECWRAQYEAKYRPAVALEPVTEAMLRAADEALALDELPSTPHEELTLIYRAMQRAKPLYAAVPAVPPRDLPHEVLRWIEHDLRIAGCNCEQPLLGWRIGKGPRCRLCNTEAYGQQPKEDDAAS